MKVDLGSVQGPAGPVGPQGPAGDTKIRELIDHEGAKGVIYTNGYGYVAINLTDVRIGDGKTILKNFNIGKHINIIHNASVNVTKIDGNSEMFDRFKDWWFTAFADEEGRAVIKGVNTGGNYGWSCELSVTIWFHAS